MATVIIPTPLRKFVGNSSRVQVLATKIADVLDELTLHYPELKKHLRNADGAIPSFINIFVGDDDIRVLEQEQTPVSENTIISIVPAIAGGSNHPKE
jgi:molybdopterin converting factor small subunit